MDDDPFSVLLKIVQSILLLEPTRNGNYTYPAIKQLKEATKQYDPQDKASFNPLLKAITESMPHIEKWKINFSALKKALDSLAKKHELPPINWIPILSHPKLSLHFQFSALNHSEEEESLTTWLSIKTGQSFFQMSSGEITQALIRYINHAAFKIKLRLYEEQNPDFLFNLIMDSEKNFIKLCSSRLILHLTDQQIAKALIKHLACFLSEEEDLFEQSRQVVHHVNEILSNGCSILTLFRNTKAKAILMQSIYFQLYERESESKPQLAIHPRLEEAKHLLAIEKPAL